MCGGRGEDIAERGVFKQAFQTLHTPSTRFALFCSCLTTKFRMDLKGVEEPRCERGATERVSYKALTCSLCEDVSNSDSLADSSTLNSRPISRSLT